MKLNESRKEDLEMKQQEKERKRERDRQEKEIEDEGERINSWTVCIEKEGDRKAQNALSQCSQVD